MIAPKLRFSEFKDEWFEKKLEEIATVERGKFSPRPRNDPKFYNGEMPFIQTGDVANCGIYLEKYTQTLNEEGIKVSKVFPKNSILITIAANIGDTAITRFPVACPDSLVAIQPLENIANTHFLNNLLELKKEYLDSQATQNAQKNINLQVLKPLELVIPNYQEQTKIAEFLSAVDDKISQLSRQLELLNQYKKGVMQKIFSQEIRFKNDNGEDFGEWDFGELKKFCVVNPKTEEIPDNFYYVDLESVDSGRLLHMKKVLKKNSPSRASRVLAKKDILFQTVRPYQQNNFYFNLEGDFVASTGYAQIKTEKNNPKFIYYLLHTKSFLDEVLNRCTGTSYPAINGTDLSTIEVQMPTIQEQKKIAEFLTAIDERIDHTTAQLTYTKQWKKGLLQQMFV